MRPYNNITLSVSKPDIVDHFICWLWPWNCNQTTFNGRPNVISTINLFRRLAKDIWQQNKMSRRQKSGFALRRRHNGRDSVLNRKPHDCLFNVNSDGDQRKHQRSASLAFVRGIHRWPVNSPHKWPVSRKMSPFDDVIMNRAFSG